MQVTLHIRRYNPESDARPHEETYAVEADPNDPLLGLAVLKDLIVDMKPFFDHYRSVMPYLVNDEPTPEKERPQTPEERQRFDDTTKCILCAACTTSCPSFWADGEYVGPAAIVLAHRF